VMRMNEIDLPQKYISQMVTIFSTYPEIEKVVIFFFFFLSNAKPGSDIDLAFSGQNLTSQIVNRIQNHLEEETLMPYFFDCIYSATIKNQDLLLHIQTYGKLLYNKDSMSLKKN